MGRLLSTLLLVLSVIPLSPNSLNAADTSTIKFDNTKGQKTRGLLAKPDGVGPFPAIVLLHSCGGATSHVTHDWPNFLTKNGYITLMPYVYRSRGFENCNDNSRSGRNLSHFHDDAYGALDYLTAQPFVDSARVGVMGFSMGANAINTDIIRHYVFQKREPNFKAAISLYGFCKRMDPSIDGTIPVLLILAENDKKSVKQCAGMKVFRRVVSVEILPDADHAFDSLEASGRYDASGNFMSYSSSATRQAQTLALQYLQKRMP